MELIYGLSVEAEIDVIKGPLTLLRELALERYKNDQKIDPAEVLNILDGER